MNDVTIFIYLVFFVALAAATFAYMFKMMTSTLADFDKRPVRSYSDAMRAYTPHPEEPKDGEEVMGVTFKSCDLDDYGKLQSRINELREKLEDEDDGDIIVRS
jgi:hypothetical protein|tara:strand:- start:264 stop:572 length:309 start_codon:yes stop_codon:yes gene_type:complete